MHASGNTYRNLIIVASSEATEIWLGDDDGHLVQMEVGVLNSNLHEGSYTVEFGLGTTTYPVHLTADVHVPSYQPMFMLAHCTRASLHVSVKRAVRRVSCLTETETCLSETTIWVGLSLCWV